MSISVAKRREACLRLLRSDFDIDATVEWVMKEYADDPSFERAKNKERLARNIVTIGGSGDQQALNLVAFQQALSQYAVEQNRKVINAQEAEAAKLQRDLDYARSQRDETEKEYRDQVRMVQNLRERLSQAEVKALTDGQSESDAA